MFWNESCLVGGGGVWNEAEDPPLWSLFGVDVIVEGQVIFGWVT